MSWLLRGLVVQRRPKKIIHPEKVYGFKAKAIALFTVASCASCASRAGALSG